MLRGELDLVDNGAHWVTDTGLYRNFFLDFHLVTHNSIVNGKYINDDLEMNVRVIPSNKSNLRTMHMYAT